MAYEAAFANLHSVCERTRQELASYRQQRPEDDDAAFIDQSVRQYIAAGREVKDHRQSHRMMALSVYSIVVQCDRIARAQARIAELEDALLMRDQALEIAWHIIDENEREDAP